MSKAKTVKAWGLVSRVSGNAIDIWPTRAIARERKLSHEDVKRVEYRILPNAGNRKSA